MSFILDREKVSKFYYSSTSHGSSHTSGIEMDQRHDDEEQGMNRYLLYDEVLNRIIELRYRTGYCGHFEINASI